FAVFLDDNIWMRAFENTKDIVPNAAVKSPHPNVVIQKYCKNVMIECVVRGYLWGSLAGEYEKGTRDIYGIKMPEGMLRYQKLIEPIFTPTTKADDHDAPMTFEEVEKHLGKELAKKVKDLSIALYNRGAELAEKRGLIFIDTKYEFGLDEKGNIFLIDEANTPDSSRYCSAEEYKKFAEIKTEASKYENVTKLLNDNPKLKIKEMSKQFVRDVLIEKGFSYGSTGAPPALLDEDVIEVSYRYISLYEKLTGNKFEFPNYDVKQELLYSLKSEGYIKGGVAVIIAGSDSDMPHIQNIKEELDKYDIPSIVRICSAHKQPARCEEIINKYNQSVEPIVFVSIAGGTDALSGVVSFHSVHPVISCPPNKEEYESCIKNPPGSSNSLILRPANVARHVAKILGHGWSELQGKILDNNRKKIEKLEQADDKSRGKN
ncbi:phosphoribosylaminoimidazolesuccinocarboxamide synthase, partial [Bacteroidota bacterium]